MKIAIISNLYPPFQRGGAEIIAQRMAQEYARLGHEVVVITTHPWSEERTFRPVSINESGMQVYRYAVPNLYYYRNDTYKPIFVRLLWHCLDLLNFFAASTCKKILRKEQPDLVITHNLMGMSYFIPAVIRSLGLKQIHVLHDIQLIVRSGLMRKGEEASFQSTSFFAKLYQWYTRLLFGDPDLVVSPSEFLKRFYTERGYFKRKEIQVIRNPISQQFFSVSNNINKSNQQVIFGYVGQLERHKGIDILQQAILSIGESNFALEIVGDGALLRQVQKWAETDPRVVYKGRIPNEELSNWYQRIDCLIVPTLVYENSPTVVLEAMASGIPVIASDIGGTGELVTQGSGVLIAAGDVDNLQEAVEHFIKTSESYDSQSIKNLVKDYNLEAYCKKLLESIFKTK